MKPLVKRLLCAASVATLILPDIAAAQAQYQHTQRTVTRTTAKQPRRTVTRTTVRQPNRTVTRTVVRNGRQTNVRTVVTTRPEARPLPTYRIGRRPATFHRIRATTVFRYPSGYSYRRFRTGSMLPRPFLSSAYFVDPFQLGVGRAPPGYVWVRYGPDLLLVNRYNGRIVDVIYGAFY